MRPLLSSRPPYRALALTESVKLPIGANHKQHPRRQGGRRGCATGDFSRSDHRPIYRIEEPQPAVRGDNRNPPTGQNRPVMRGDFLPALGLIGLVIGHLHRPDHRAALGVKTHQLGFVIDHKDRPPHHKCRVHRALIRGPKPLSGLRVKG